ncbi:DUF4439 domain-containing protein [Ornithinimicrobium tianjinense]|nr:DUF4439 domain-containing protein [Ornithinimicrobium tianjinense]
MPRPSRRSLLRGLVLGGSAAFLSACDSPGRDDSSPTGRVVPDDPTTWPDDTELLVAARQRIHAHLSMLRATRVPGRAKALDGRWETQIARIEQLITLGGLALPPLEEPSLTDLPADDEAGTTAPRQDGDGDGDSDEAAATTSAGPEAIDVGRLLRAQLPSVVAEIATSTPTNLAMLVSLAAEQADSAHLLGARVDWAPLTGPSGVHAVRVLQATRPAVFGLEVVAARATGEERETYLGVLDQVRALTRQLTTLAGEAAPAPPLGYDLPEPLEDADQRKRLASSLVADIAPATLQAAERLVGRADQLMAAVRVVAEATRWSRELGGPSEPFPGMTLP